MTFIRGTDRANGYTLLEICMALMVLAIITAFLVPSTQGILSEERLRGVINEVADLARNARHQAVSDGHPYAILPSGGALQLIPWAGDASKPSPAQEKVRFPGDVALELRPCGNAPGNPGEVVAWIFQPNGLSDPMEVRVRSGKSWIVERFSPLTAAVEDESSSFE